MVMHLNSRLPTYSTNSKRQDGTTCTLQQVPNGKRLPNELNYGIHNIITAYVLYMESAVHAAVKHLRKRIGNSLVWNLSQKFVIVIQ